jgi:hypothetical protein
MTLYFASFLTLLNRKLILIVALVGFALPISGNLFSYDYYNYTNSIENGYNARWMPLQKLIAYISKETSLDLFFSINFACVCLLAYLVSRKITFGNIFLFCCLVFPKGIIWSLFLPRQYLAAYFLLLAFSYGVLNKTKTKRLFIFLLSFMSHKSAFIMFPFLFVYFNKFFILFTCTVIAFLLYFLAAHISDLFSVYLLLTTEIARSGFSYIILCAPWFIYPWLTLKGHRISRWLLLVFYISVLISYDIIFSLSLRLIYVALPFAIFSCFNNYEPHRQIDKIFLRFVFPFYSCITGAYFYFPFFDGFLRIGVVD